MNTFAGIPGPPPTFPFGNALAFMGGNKKPWEVCADWGREYGGMTLVWLLGQPAIVLNDPQLIGEVLETNWQAFTKTPPTMRLLRSSRRTMFLLRTATTGVFCATTVRCAATGSTAGSARRCR